MTSNAGAGTNGTGVSTIYTLKNANWMDSADDQSLQLDIDAYLKIGDDSFLIVPPAKQLDFYFMLPVMATSSSSVNVKLCSAAKDKYQSFASACVYMENLNSGFTSVSAMLATLLTFDMTNRTQLMLACNSLYLALEFPRRPSNHPGMCTLDYHCYYKGECESSASMKQCVCETGYQGSFC